MANELATVNTAALPSALRRMVNQWAGDVKAGGDTRSLARIHGEAAVTGLRGTGEGAVMGSLLGAFHALSPTGLDLKIPGTTHKIPVDAVGALVGLIGGIGAATAPRGMGTTVANGGVACAVVFGFRQTNDLIVKLRQKKTGVTQASNRVISKAEFGAEGGWSEGGSEWANKHRGSFNGEHPILKAARNL